MFSHKLLLTVLLLIFFQSTFAESTYCSTRYPLLLVHGISFSEKTPGLRYWGCIPRRLEENGAVVYLSGQNLYATHQENALQLKERIEFILEHEQVEKINIIAHSKGGIESRYMISKCGMGEKVASLTTLCTPHRGSAMAGVIYDEMDKNIHLRFFLSSAAVFAAAMSGDESASPYLAGAQLSREYMKEFNREVKDHPSVYYQSYASEIKADYPSPVWQLMYSVMHYYEGENDGLVSVESAKWGNYRGIITVSDSQYLSHADVVCMSPVERIDPDKIFSFYKELVHELGVKGY